MGFTDQQNKMLSAPLSSSHVRGREQGGRRVSYVEGWHVIAEANRIFGFDGWSRQTMELKCVSERERPIGQAKAPGWGVSYIAKVRIVVGELVREGCGAGHGIDRDLGQAHESALKEAETDAMKRAFMTFGNPFGLALYDKEQANVADDPTPDLRTAFIADRTTQIAKHDDYHALGAWWNSQAEKDARIGAGLDNSDVSDLKKIVLARLEQLKPKANAA